MGRTTRVLAGGIYFGEGPRWHEERLWFSDVHAHTVKSVSLAGDLRTESPTGKLLIATVDVPHAGRP